MSPPYGRRTVTRNLHPRLGSKYKPNSQCSSTDEVERSDTEEEEEEEGETDEEEEGEDGECSDTEEESTGTSDEEEDDGDDKNVNGEDKVRRSKSGARKRFKPSEDWGRRTSLQSFD